MLCGVQRRGAAGTLCLEGREYVVQEVVDQYYGPEQIFFKIRADDCHEYVLRHQTSVPDGAWDLISFRERRQ